MSWLESSRGLSVLSSFLHLALVATHLALLVVWFQRSEHRFVFAVEHERFVSRAIKVILTTFGTIHSALLVFVTQTLAFRRDFRRSQSLTATHDNIGAWTGLGSAVAFLWQQRAIPASIWGVLSGLIYLANILVLHVTFPALLAVETVVLQHSNPVTTQSLPAFNFSGYDLSNENDHRGLMRSAEQYAGGSLSFLPFIGMNATTPGLHAGTLYDVLSDTNRGTGLVSVDATGFNISCGYLPDTTVDSTSAAPLACPCLNLGDTQYSLGLTDTQIIAPLSYSIDDATLVPPAFPTPAIFYTDIPILDSNNNTGHWVNLSGSIGTEAIQLFRCSLSLVEQTALLDAQSHELISVVGPVVDKTTSAWQPFAAAHSQNLSDIAFGTPEGFLDIWEGWYGAMPAAEAPLLLSDAASLVRLSVADTALLQQLKLFPFNDTVRNNISLHQVENQLANIVASMFWTLGHVPPLRGYNSLNSTATTPPPLNISLLVGNATVQQMVVRERLDLNIIAIIQGLLASGILMFLSVQFLHFAQTENCVQIDGVGLLHSIWVFRHHPQLDTLLKQVKHPTNLHLRQAGMLRTRLAGPSSNGQERSMIGLESETDYEPVMSSEGNGKARASKESRWMSHRSLSLASAVIHSTLVAIHIALVVLSAMAVEHQVVFPLEQQPRVSWIITTSSTTFATIFLAVLVFLTQTLAFRRSLQKVQTLTATHDSTAAWSGIGSALVHVWQQKAVPASIFGVLSAFLYLGSILVLHITTPALLSVQPSNFDYSTRVTTKSLPTFNFSGYDPSSQNARLDVLHSPLLYAKGSLFFLPFLNSSAPTLGLHGETLYDVLESNSGTGNVAADAIAFNMSCSYFSDPVVNSTAGSIDILGTSYSPGYTDLGIISTLNERIPFQDNITVPPFAGSSLFYSAIPIVDSAGDSAPWVNITGMTDGFPAIQIFRCSLQPVKQRVIVDSQSHELISAGQEMNKTASLWRPAEESNDAPTDADLPEQALVNDWESWYSAMPLSNIPRNYASDRSLTVAEIVLIEELNLNSFNSSGRTNITLHDFENKLSALVASMYWTLGHVPPLPGYTPISLTAIGPPPVDVSLLQGSALVTESKVESRLDLSMGTAVGGLVASVVLLLLSLQFLDFRKIGGHNEDVSIGEIGLLHAIWLYRSHPELEARLDQVIHPTNVNLRKAGMIRTRLAGSLLGRQKSWENSADEAD